jgi:hypothetical protein
MHTKYTIMFFKETNSDDINLLSRELTEYNIGKSTPPA